ncbi:MAG: NAD(P)/FAD-dependent oxidoreductase [Bacteroidales bacterium]|nr:NAD(P)/FAD-dependent oxidoreductase [Bacteroidales bacterium]
MSETVTTKKHIPGDRSPDLVIIGGGITGLSAAYMAAVAGKKVTVIEAGENFGGLLSTFEIGGNRLEYYYHHFFTHDRELHWLINELGLKEKLIYRKTSMGVYNRGKIYHFDTPLDLLRFRPINFIDKIRFGLTSIYLGKIARWKKNEDIACINWFSKWAGKSTTSALWSPLLKIKFGPYASQVPLSWMIGRLRQRMNSRKSGDERLGYLEGSLQLLLDTLLQKLTALGVELVPNAPVEKITFENNRVTAVRTPLSQYTGNNFLFTIPGTYLSRLLENEQPQLAQRLSNIRYFGAVCVILELSQPLSDIYWLNIADKDFPFGGIIEHTNFIAEREYNGSHIAYLSRYFAGEEAIASMTEAEIKELMIKYLPKIYPGFDKRQIKNSFVFRTNTAATVCDLNFSEKVPGCKTETDNLYIANMSHVYPDERSTNNSIKIAAEAMRCMGIPTTIPEKSNSLSGKIGF